MAMLAGLGVSLLGSAMKGGNKSEGSDEGTDKNLVIQYYKARAEEAEGGQPNPSSEELADKIMQSKAGKEQGQDPLQQLLKPITQMAGGLMGNMGGGGGGGGFMGIG